MSRRTLLLAASVGLVLLAAGVLGTLWILRQPLQPAETAPIERAASTSAEPEPSASAPEPEAAAAEGHIRVTLYVLDPDGRTLATESQEVPLESSAQQQAKQVVQLLLRRSSAIPNGVELRELFITSQGVAYVDLSRELVANHPGGSSAEELTVFSLTNTLIVNLPVIKLVKILVEGREVQTLAGHLDLTVPYGRAPDYLRPESEIVEARDEAG